MQVLRRLKSYIPKKQFWNADNKRNCRFYNDIYPDEISNISLSTIKRTLNSNNVNFEEGYVCLITTCPMCHQTTRSQTSSKFYINKTTGFFVCHSCKANGPWSILEKYLTVKNGKPKFIFQGDAANTEVEKIISTSKLLNKCSEEFVSMICDKFSLPVVPNNTLNTLNLRVDEQLNSLFVPLNNAEGLTLGFKVIPNNENQIEKTIPSINCGGIFIGKHYKSREGLGIIVPSVKDVFALLNQKVSGNFICLPYGLSCLPQTTLPNFEKFNKLVLWFGNDVGSWDMARIFAKKLGEKRCYFVRPTDKQPLPHSATKEDFKSIISTAQPIWHKSITTFSSLRQDVLSDLQNIDKVQGVKWKRYPTLSKILKGHRRGELTVITGPTGSGKTTFISEYSLDLAIQGVNTLWGSFEIRNARLARTMLQQMSGFELDENLDKFEEMADMFEQLPIYFMTFHGQQTIKVVMEAVEHATYVHDIAHVVIDNVQFMLGMSDESKHMDRFWKQDSIVAAFRAFATRKNCHVTLVIHPRKERDTDDLTTSSIFGGAKASQEADNILIIQDKRLIQARGKKYLQVAKNRYSGDLGIMPMEFEKQSLSYAQKRKKVIDDKPGKET